MESTPIKKDTINLNGLTKQKIIALSQQYNNAIAEILSTYLDALGKKLNDYNFDIQNVRLTIKEEK